MAFQFRFQSILDVKIRLEDLKKAKFGEANEELRIQTEKLSVLVNEQNFQYESMKEKNKKGVTPKDLIVYNNYMNRLKQAIEIQKKVIEKAKDAVEFARRELVEAAKERKKFETLKEKKLEEYWEEYYKKEQTALDEIVSYKYNGGVADGSSEG
ncbi:MAG: flagellar export protein FliJ [Clostridia bacterium]|nr:flagellar export protein FliJ [Clostridia bacterium]